MTCPRLAVVVLFCCGVAPAAEPATAPAALQVAPRAAPSPFGNRMVRLRDLGLIGREWPQLPAGQTADADDWANVVEFGRANFPNRWALFESLQTRRGEDNPLVRTLHDRFLARYRLLMQVQSRMPDLYDAAIKQGKLEDDAWAAVIEFRKKPTDSELSNDMRKKVGALVKNLLDERQERLHTIQQALADEQKQLESDRDNVDDLVERQIARLSGDDPSPDPLTERSYRGWGGFNRGFGPGRRDGRADPTTRP